MKVNDIYKNTSPLFDAPADDFSRYCIVREVCGETVKFSVAADEQPQLTEGIIKFNPSTFTTSRAAITEHMVFAETSRRQTDKGR